MRIFKKIVMIILALLPIMSFLLFSLTNVGNTSGQPYRKMGAYFIRSSSAGGHNLYVEQNSISSELFNSLTNGNSYSGVYTGTGGVLYDHYRTVDGTLFDTVLKFALELQELGFSSPCLIAFLYILYMVFIEFIMFLYEFILFIPKKCREIFGG